MAAGRVEEAIGIGAALLTYVKIQCLAIPVEIVATYL
jgi:hypothetical protein